MFNKLLGIAVALAIMGSAARAAQIGDTEQSLIPLSARVTVPGSPQQNMPTEVTHVTLDSGVWSVSGQINIWSQPAPVGSLLFVAGNISLDEPSFEPRATAVVKKDRVTIALSGGVIQTVSLVPRIVEVGNGTEVFLVVGNFNPTLPVTAWGFLTAVKLRNNVE